MLHVAVPEWVQATFGARYPVTYIFDVPDEPGLTAYFRHDETDPWTTLTAKVRPEGFNGDECVRFDGTKAYVSAAFGEDTSDLWIKVENDADEEVGVFDQVATYYDDRMCPVVLTHDDWHADFHSDFLAMLDVHQSYGLWASTGINAGGLDGDDPLLATHWSDMQTEVDEGFVEPNNHGHTHQFLDNVTEVEAEAEVAGGADAITGNVTLPWQSRRGASQFVLGFVEPFGRELNHEAKSELAGSGHINQRRFSTTTATITYISWDGTYSVFNRQVVSANLDQLLARDGDTATANARFDTAYNGGGIYHGVAHPYLDGTFSWEEGADWEGWQEPAVYHGHFDHISGRDDVWYVGWGHLYTYRLTTIELTATDDPPETNGENGPSVMTIFEDDFTGDDDDPWDPAKWTTSVSGTSFVDIQSNTGRTEVANQTDAVALAIASESSEHTDGRYTCIWKPMQASGTSTRPWYYVWLRASGDWDVSTNYIPSNGYAAVIDLRTERLLLVKSVAGTDTEMVTADIFSWLAEDEHHMICEVDDDTIRAKVWKVGDPEPEDFTLQTTDTDVAGPGRLQISLRRVSGGPWDWRTDDVVLQDLSPTFDPANLQATVDGDTVSLSWDASPLVPA